MKIKRGLKITRRVRTKDIDVVKIEGLKEFIRFCNKKPFWKRVKIGLLIVFKRLSI
jgi:hypothetical protein